MPDFDIIQALQDKDDKRAYELSKELISLSASSPELGAELKKWAESFDTSNYKDSMAPLIDRDLISLLKLIDELN